MTADSAHATRSQRRRRRIARDAEQAARARAGHDERRRRRQEAEQRVANWDWTARIAAAKAILDEHERTTANAAP